MLNGLFFPLLTILLDVLPQHVRLLETTSYIPPRQLDPKDTEGNRILIHRGTLVPPSPRVGERPESLKLAHLQLMRQSETRRTRL